MDSDSRISVIKLKQTYESLIMSSFSLLLIVPSFFFLSNSTPLFGSVGSIALRYYADWTIQFLMTIFYFLIIFANLSFYIGMCFYIGAMVNDLKITTEVFNTNSSCEFKKQFVEGIVFHNGILE